RSRVAASCAITSGADRSHLGLGLDRLARELAHLGPATSPLRHHPAHLVKLAEAQDPIAVLEDRTLARVGDDGRAAMQCEDRDVAVAEPRVIDRLADEVAIAMDDELGDAV